MTRANVHKKVMQRDFKSTHRLGERPHLLLLRHEVEGMREERRARSEDAEEADDSRHIGGSYRSSGKTNMDEFLSRCSREDREYFEHLFQTLTGAHFKYWMGEKGFAIGGIIRGYPTYECRFHGLRVHMEQIPRQNMEAVRSLLSSETEYDSEILAAGKNPQFAVGELPVELVLRIVKTALGR
jgi:hypothetical protein